MFFFVLVSTYVQLTSLQINYIMLHLYVETHSNNQPKSLAFLYVRMVLKMSHLGSRRKQYIKLATYKYTMRK